MFFLNDALRIAATATIWVVCTKVVNRVMDKTTFRDPNIEEEQDGEQPDGQPKKKKVIDV